MNKHLLKYVPRAVSLRAGIHASVLRHVLGSLVKYIQEQSHVQEQSEVGSTSEAAQAMHEVTGHRSLRKLMKQTLFG